MQKPVSEFYRSKANADGYDGRCKVLHHHCGARGLRWKKVLYVGCGCGTKGSRNQHCSCVAYQYCVQVHARTEHVSELGWAFFITHGLSEKVLGLGNIATPVYMVHAKMEQFFCTRLGFHYYS